MGAPLECEAMRHASYTYLCWAKIRGHFMKAPQLSTGLADEDDTLQSDETRFMRARELFDGSKTSRVTGSRNISANNTQLGAAVAGNSISLTRRPPSGLGFLLHCGAIVYCTSQPDIEGMHLRTHSCPMILCSGALHDPDYSREP